MWAEYLLDLWRIAPALLLALALLWSGHKGWWYWDAGVRRLVEQLERERDVWRTLACALLRKEGVNLPESFLMLEGELTATKPASRRGEDRGDPWKPTM